MPFNTDSPSRSDRLDASAAAIPHGNLAVLYDDRYLPAAVGQFQHLVQLAGVLFDVMIVMTGQSLPGSVGVGSARFTVDRYLFRHGASVLHCSSMVFYWSSFTEPGPANGLKHFLLAPHTGQHQSSGISSKSVPLDTLPFRSPRSGS